MTSLSIMRLLDEKGEIAGGKIIFDGEDVMAIPESKMMKIRGNRNDHDLSRNPMTALNPVFTIGFQIMEAILLHQDVDEKARQMAIDMLKESRDS